MIRDDFTSIKIQTNTINVINGLTHVLGHAHFHVLSLKLLHHLRRFLGIHHLVHLLHRLKTWKRNKC